MKKYDKILFCRIIPIFFIIVFFVLPVLVNAWNPADDIPDGQDSIISSTTSSVMGSVRTVVEAVATSLMVTMLIYIGIKYITSAPEGRAEYKKMAIPYIVGVVLITQTEFIIGQISNISGDNNALKNIVSPTVDAFGVAVRYVGEVLAVIMLIIIGIKYIMAAPEGKAEYRKTMVPYVIGALLIFTASDAVARQIAGGDFTMFTNQLSGVQSALTTVAEAVAVIMLLIIGFKYMTSAPEGKAEYRKIMVPYIIGAVIVFTTALGSNAIIKTIKTEAGVQVDGFNETYESESVKVLSTILGALRYIGVGMALIMLVILALKYIMASPEGKAEFSKTAIPYVIGAVVLFASSSIVGIIQAFATTI